MANLKDLIVNGSARFLNKIYGTISNADIAEKATKDSEGNIITNTYLTTSGSNPVFYTSSVCDLSLDDDCPYSDIIISYNSTNHRLTVPIDKVTKNHVWNVIFTGSSLTSTSQIILAFNDDGTGFGQSVMKKGDTARIFGGPSKVVFVINGKVDYSLF